MKDVTLGPSYKQQNIRGFQFKLKSSASMPTLLVKFGPLKDELLIVTIDQSPLLLPAESTPDSKNYLGYPVRVVLRGMEFQSEFLESPEDIRPWLAELTTNLAIFESGTTVAFSLQLPDEAKPDDYHRYAPDGSMYVDVMMRVECTREVLMEFAQLARLESNAMFGNQDMTMATLTAVAGKDGGH